MREPPPQEPDPTALGDPPQFLSTGALQDPTLRTPGSEIPDSIYAASDAKPFNVPRGQPDPDQSPLPADPPALGMLLILTLVAIIVATVIYLYRDTHRPPTPAPAPPAVHSTAPA